MGSIPLGAGGQGRPAENDLSSSNSRASGIAFLLRRTQQELFSPGLQNQETEPGKVNRKLFNIKLPKNLLLVKNSCNLLTLTSVWISAKHFLSYNLLFPSL